MARRHLALLCVAGALVAAAEPAAASVRWHEVARGSTAGGAASNRPTAVVVTTRAGSRAIATRLPRDGRASLAGVDLSRSVVVGIFGNFGCTDHRVAVRSLSRRGAVLRIVLVTHPLRADEMECQAIFGTYRLLVVPRAQLGTTLPVRAEVVRA